MAIKKFIVSAFAVAALGSAAFAQVSQPNQPPKEGIMRPGVRKMERAPRGDDGRRPRMMRRGAFPRRGGMMNFERLNLTDAQKQRIQAIQASARNSREASKSQFEEMGNLMRLKREGLLTSDQGTRLNALQVQMQTQMKANAEKMQADILAVLTPDQKTLLGQMRNRRTEGRRMRGEMPRPRQTPMPNRGEIPSPTDN